MEVGIKVISENLTSKDSRHTISCYFTMVARTIDGASCEVPPLEIETELDRRLFEAGKMRKELRQEIIERNRVLHERVDE
jgi:acyl-CoA hydrolase